MINERSEAVKKEEHPWAWWGCFICSRPLFIVFEDEAT